MCQTLPLSFQEYIPFVSLTFLIACCYYKNCYSLAPSDSVVILVPSGSILAVSMWYCRYGDLFFLVLVAESALFHILCMYIYFISAKEGQLSAFVMHCSPSLPYVLTVHSLLQFLTIVV